MIGREACPSSTVSGTSLTPGIGFPFAMSSTIWLKDIGCSAVAPLSSGVVSMPFGADETSLGGLLLMDGGLDAEIKTDLPLAREEDW